MIACLAVLLLSPPTLLSYSIEQWKRTPEMRVEDAYKWLFHATMGGEHAITSEAGPRSWMDHEWPTLTEPMKGEQEIEKLTPDGTVIRVNMRLFRKRGGDKEVLLKAFVQSAKGFKTDKSKFITAWTDLGKRLQTGPIQKLNRKDWLRVDAKMKPEKYPAIDHSAVYEKSYRPAYRVVSSKLWTTTAK